jgi:hypothetical protein
MSFKPCAYILRDLELLLHETATLLRKINPAPAHNILVDGNFRFSGTEGACRCIQILVLLQWFSENTTSNETSEGIGVF